MNTTVIKFDETPLYRIKQILDIAGFQSENCYYGIRLIDKKSTNADKYADLQFRSLREAVRALTDYIAAIHYKIIL